MTADCHQNNKIEHTRTLKQTHFVQLPFIHFPEKKRQRLSYLMSHLIPYLNLHCLSLVFEFSI